MCSFTVEPWANEELRLYMIIISGLIAVQEGVIWLTLALFLKDPAFTASTRRWWPLAGCLGSGH